MRQVLWLTSWYPNKYDLYTGDFIKRHAQATAAFCKIHVIHVQLVPPNFQEAEVTIEILKQAHFTETIIYIKQSTTLPPLSKIINQFRYEKYFKKAIVTYLLQNTMPDLVHVHVPVKAGKLGLWMKKNFGINYLLTEHYGIYNNEALGKFTSRSTWFKYLTKRVVDNCTIFLPVSNNLGKAVNAMVTTKEYQVVYNVVDTNIFNFNPQKNDAYFWFIHVSTMDHPKNPEGLLRGFAKAHQQNSSLRLRMVGTTNSEVLALVKVLGLTDCIVFTGMISQVELAVLLNQSCAFLLFSNYENMPCVIAEALCCGLPIISTNVGGISEIVNDTNGILISAKNEIALVEAMLFMYLNLDKYNGLKIFNEAKKRFSYATIGNEIVDVYNNIKNSESIY